jgi:hypothetical protein
MFGGGSGNFKVAQVGTPRKIIAKRLIPAMVQRSIFPEAASGRI